MSGGFSYNFPVLFVHEPKLNFNVYTLCEEHGSQSKLKCRTQYETRVSHEGQRTVSCRTIIIMELHNAGEKTAWILDYNIYTQMFLLKSVE